MKILGIDQSITHTAYILIETNGFSIQDHGVLKTIKNVGEREEFSYTTRIKNLRDGMLRVINNNQPDFIAMEGLSMARNSTTARPLGGLFYIFTVLFEDLEIEFDIIPPKTVKKTAISGNASKEEVFEALPEDVKELFIESGFKKTTGLYDLADSYFIAKTAWNKIQGS